MNDDLSKAEQEWATRSLFRPQRRRRGRWLWFVMLAVVIVMFIQYRDEFLTVF